MNFEKGIPTQRYMENITICLSTWEHNECRSKLIKSRELKSTGS